MMDIKRLPFCEDELISFCLGLQIHSTLSCLRPGSSSHRPMAHLFPVLDPASLQG